MTIKDTFLLLPCYPHLFFAHLRFLWNCGYTKEAYDKLSACRRLLFHFISFFILLFPSPSLTINKFSPVFFVQQPHFSPYNTVLPEYILLKLHHIFYKYLSEEYLDFDFL